MYGRAMRAPKVLIMNLEFLVTRTIYETPAISQRALSKKFFVSLGKINSTISDLINKNYIAKSDKEGLYSVTKTGEIEIKKHIVDGAVILACGKGLRLTKTSDEIPICFIEINGERLIERQIKQLKEAGITNIAIAVGFMKEKFDYLIDKYNVKLVYNDEYKYKNTLSTFHNIKELIRNKNIYICVSDIYMDENLFHNYEIEPYYTGVFRGNCKNEWRYISNSKNEIKGVEVGGENDFCLAGHAFLTKEFTEKLIPIIDEYYDKTFTDNYYWEDALVKNLDALPSIYVYEFHENEIFEFDNLKDIEDFNKSNPKSNAKIIEYIKKVFKVEEKNIENFKCEKDKVANYIYSFNIKKDEYCLRVPKENANKFINRKNEYNILKELKNLDLTENIVDFDVTNGYKISKCEEGFRPVNPDKKSELKAALSAYKKLHTSGVVVSGNCDIISMIDKYLDIIKKNGVSIPYEDFNEVLDKVNKVKDLIAKEKRPVTICHGDPNPENILYSNDKCKIVEFEYGGMADPLSDLALFATYNEYGKDEAFALYEEYKKTYDNDLKNKILPSDDKARTLMISYMALAGFYNALWSVVREMVGNAEYGAFGLNGYRVFKNCFAILGENLWN